MNNKAALDALMSIEGFPNLNQEIETIINKSEAVKKARKEANDEELSAKEKKKLTEEEKEYKSLAEADSGKARQVRNADTGVHVLDRLPGAMSERCHYSTGTGIVQEGYGLTVKDFELLVALGCSTAD